MSGNPIAICVCIDDFGMHDGINEAAFELTMAGRVSAISCMVGGPAWLSGAATLRADLAGKADIGLHLDFTELSGHPAQPHSLPGLIASAYCRLLSSAAVSAEVSRQFDAFEDAFGAPPDFVDGHQHVHQLPVIREALIGQLKRRYPGHHPWIRNTARSRAGRDLKAAIIAMMGSAAMRDLAQHGGFPQNRHLLGVYGFEGSDVAYRRRMDGWLAMAVDGDLLMCHPASCGDTEHARARRIEYNFFRSEACAGLLRRHNISLVRLSQHEL